MKDSTKAYLLVLLFFLPYFPRSTFRPDHVYGMGCVVLLFVHLVMHGRTREGLAKNERVVMQLVLVAFAWSTVRILLDLDLPLQVINYTMSFLVGIAVWYVHRSFAIRAGNEIIRVVLLVSIPVNLYAIYQYAYPDHGLTKYLLEIYNGPGDASYDVAALLGKEFAGLQTIAAGEVLSGTSMTSIFTGKHSLATFSLFSLALGVGVATDASYRAGRRTYLCAIAIAAALAGGILSTSKVFILGAPIYFVGLTMFYLELRRTRYATVMLVVLLVAVAGAILVGNRLYVLGNIVDALMSGNFDTLFESRFGSQGYLTDNNRVFLDPLVWLVGLGAEAGAAKISDNQFRSILLIGGVPYLLVFLATPFYLLRVMWRARRLSMMSVSFFCLGIAYLAGSVGIEVYWQARTIPLWILVNLIIIHRTAQGIYRVADRPSRSQYPRAPKLAQ